MPQLPTITSDPLAAVATATAAASVPQPELSEQQQQQQEMIHSERDDLQGAVRDNPEMAAAVLSQWLKAG